MRMRARRDCWVAGHHVLAGSIVTIAPEDGANLLRGVSFEPAEDEAPPAPAAEVKGPSAKKGK